MRAVAKSFVLAGVLAAAAAAGSASAQCYNCRSEIYYRPVVVHHCLRYVPQLVYQPQTQVNYVPVTSYRAVYSTHYVPATVYRPVYSSWVNE